MTSGECEAAISRTYRCERLAADSTVRPFVFCDPPHRVDEILRSGQILGNELRNLVPVATQLSFGAFEGQPCPANDELTRGSDLNRLAVGGQDLVDRCRRSHDNPASVGTPGENQMLAERIRITRVTELEEIDQCYRTLALSLRRKPCDPKWDQQGIIPCAESSFEQRVGAADSTPPPRRR